MTALEILSELGSNGGETHEGETDEVDDEPPEYSEVPAAQEAPPIVMQ